MSRTIHRSNHAFARAELCVVLCTCAILALTLGSSLARSREPGQRIGCVNNLRRLGAAVLVYSSENDGLFPPRNSNGRWPSQLVRYYGDLSVLRCPNDGPNPVTFGGPNPADKAARSYLMNGWDDYFVGQPFSQSVLPESAIRYPAAT